MLDHQPAVQPLIQVCPLQDLLGWTKDKSEVEVVDLILKLREKLVSSNRKFVSEEKSFM